MRGLGSVLYEYLQNVQSLIALGIAAVFILGVFNRKITPKATETQLKGITYFSQTPEQVAETRKSWNNWDVILSAGVVALVIIFYYYFW